MRPSLVLAAEGRRWELVAQIAAELAALRKTRERQRRTTRRDIDMKGAVPVYDDPLHAVVGYRHETTTGVFRLYDLEGNYLGIEEAGRG